MTDAVHVPSGTDAPIAAPAEPSSIPRTMGILSIVFGGLVALSDLFNLAGGAAFRGAFLPRMPQGQQLPPHFLEVTQRIVPYQQTQEGVMLIMSLALLIIGIGLVKFREAARKAAVAWSIVAFPVLGFRAWMAETRIWPLEQQLLRDMPSIMRSQPGANAPPFNVEQLTSTLAHGALFGSLAVLAIFPALLLILLNLHAVKQTTRDR